MGSIPVEEEELCTFFSHFQQQQRSSLPGSEGSPVLQSNRLLFANFVFWTIITLGMVFVVFVFVLLHEAPRAPKQKFRKTSNYIIRDPGPLGNNILHYPFFGLIIFFNIYILHFCFSLTLLYCKLLCNHSTPPGL